MQRRRRGGVEINRIQGRRDRMRCQKRKAHVNPHVPVEADALIRTEGTVRTGVVTSTPPDLGRRRPLSALKIKTHPFHLLKANPASGGFL